MRTLLLHDITADDVVAGVLERAGHELVRCTDARHPGFPCRGIDGACPLDGSVDVVVVVHDRPSTELALGELGVVCALRDGVPLVLAGNHTHTPIARRCDAVAEDAGDVPAACERAVDAVAGWASDVVTDATGCDATISRRGDRVVVRLARGATAHQVTVAHRAANRLFPRARIIDVTTGG